MFSQNGIACFIGRWMIKQQYKTPAPSSRNFGANAEFLLFSNIITNKLKIISTTSNSNLEDYFSSVNVRKQNNLLSLPSKNYEKIATPPKIRLF